MTKSEIGIGIIGAGFARTTQIPGFRNCDGARIVAIASGHRKHAEEVAREFNIERVESDWRRLVALPEVDLVSVVTPPALHCEMVLAALEHGKAVLCEKPMAMNAGEARRMADRARHAGRLALIDHELRFLPGRIKLRELLHNGEIGVVRHVKSVFRSDSRADTARSWNWWSDEKQGGGTLGAIGSHVIDAFRWLSGAEVSNVFCKLATHVRERLDEESGESRQVTTDDEANLLLRFTDNTLMQAATANISLSMVEAGAAEHRLEIFGSLGALMINDAGEVWRADIGAGKWQQLQSERGETAPGMRTGGWASGFTAFSKQIVAALREGNQTVADAATLEDGYRVQTVLDAARKSDQEGCWSKPVSA